jgi:flavin reductase (DIM6/NTAB) family NADH-FMN oxidoreductase RutF
MRNNDYFQSLDTVINQLEQGAFLTVKDRNEVANVMVIGWATFGIMWRRPVLMVSVRPSRHTYKLIENADDFTVTFPTTDMTKQLIFCGTKSGKDVDKFKEGGVVAATAKKTKSPIIKTPGRVYECNIINVSAINKDALKPEIIQELYQDASFHHLYFGEIVSSYTVK